MSFAPTDLDVRVSTDPRSRQADLASAAGSRAAELVRQRSRSTASTTSSPRCRCSATEDAVGAHLGTVMVAERVPSTWERLQGTSSYLLTYLGSRSPSGSAASWLLSRRIKRQTRGMEPREIAGLAEHREAMLRGIAEGVIALDPQRGSPWSTRARGELLDLPEHAIGAIELRIEVGFDEVLVGEILLRRADGDADDRVIAARDGWSSLSRRAGIASEW